MDVIASLSCLRAFLLIDFREEGKREEKGLARFGVQSGAIRVEHKRTDLRSVSSYSSPYIQVVLHAW